MAANKAVEMCRWTLEWNNPKTNPPEGQPRILVDVTLPRGEKPASLNAQWKPGTGYGIHFYGAVSLKPPRTLSESAKQSIRRKALARRMRTKNPLFADTAIAAAIAANPTYYGQEMN